MRLHIEMEDDLVDRIDRIAGRRRRSRFVRDAVVTAGYREARNASTGTPRDFPMAGIPVENRPVG